jgi:hypothetical protein
MLIAGAACAAGGLIAWATIPGRGREARQRGAP